jgi:hypothetical protein
MKPEPPVINFYYGPLGDIHDIPKKMYPKKKKATKTKGKPSILADTPATPEATDDYAHLKNLL